LDYKPFAAIVEAARNEQPDLLLLVSIYCIVARCIAVLILVFSWDLSSTQIIH
jgi:hypothetical protein